MSDSTLDCNLCIPAPDWVPVINPDIKLANIVLGDAHWNYYPAYKRPQMIDFGLAFEGEDHEHAAMRRPIGTPGYNPPVSLQETSRS